MHRDDAFAAEPDGGAGDWNEDLVLHELSDIGFALRVQALRELDLR